ncbi:MetQ/NlpA family ABC transporter substrate-binding protein [Corynebacterium coyleae]|uniref:MetQ/NlpA family ABC transporter substrate-binding protein n=1 Tax=Corynebacterium coyleae TaxID=53374 RepID=UPI00254F1C0F|nr:MetQ/NlpA family ABC transporter substrate-binding protein [Corynebacterium coyleae]MDK6493574.1 MetQ/NlpA family ABC transporter substrate-binding protein [Corynebacterium coyleae]
MKRFASIALSAAVGLGLVACSSDSDDLEPLTVLAVPTPHAEILRYVDEKNPEYELDVKVVPGGIDPNMSVANGSAAANFYQHPPYLLDWETQTGKKLVNIVGVHIEPMGMYSNSIDSIDQLKQGAKIATPNSPSDLARALILLEANGVIGLDQEIDPANVSKINLQSITDNPKDIEIVPVEDTLVIQSLSDESVAGVIATSNFALEIGLNPSEDSVIAESPENNPYVNILAANEDAAKDPRIEKLAADLSSPETAEWIREKYSGSVIPVN